MRRGGWAKFKTKAARSAEMARRTRATEKQQQEAAKHGWEKFKTPAARKKEALRRMLLRKDPLAKSMVKGLREGKSDHGKRDHAKQTIYTARHLARKQGLPLPPLPGKVAKVTAAEAERYRQAGVEKALQTAV